MMRRLIQLALLRRRRSPWSAIAVMVAVSLVASCGLPNDRAFQRYDNGDLPEVIVNTTTTTSTTTTTTTTTTPPKASTPSTSSLPTTTTMPRQPVIDRFIYLTVGFSATMRRYPLQLAAPATVDDIIEELESPPTEAAQQNLRTALRPDLVGSVEVSGGLATVDLAAEVFDGLSNNAQRRAIGQIVLTLTFFTSDEQGGIGQVLFTLDGTPFGVLLPSTGVSSQPGEPVTFDDFAPLIDASSESGSTTATGQPATATTVATAATAPANDSIPGSAPVSLPGSVPAEAPPAPPSSAG